MGRPAAHADHRGILADTARRPGQPADTRATLGVTFPIGVAASGGPPASSIHGRHARRPLVIRLIGDRKR
jgi:hypothetical protein